MDIRLVVEYPEDNSNNNDDGFFTANEAPYNDSSDSEGDTSNSNEEDINYENSNNLDDIIIPQPARNHSYLPTAQPLYPEEWCPAGKHRSQLYRKNDSGNMSTLEVNEKEDDNVVAANASDNHGQSRVSLDNTDNTDTVTPYYHYDIPPPPGLQSHNVNNSNSNTLAVMEIEEVVLFPGSVLPLRLTDRRWVDHLRNLINDARGLYGIHVVTTGGMGEVRIVIVPKSDRNRRTRRQPREGGGRTGRWQVGLIRRGVTGVSRRLRRRRTRESEEADTNNEAAEEDIDGNRQEEHNEHNHELEQSDEEDSEDEIFHPSDRPLSTVPCDDDPLVGRIGTMARKFAFVFDDLTLYLVLFRF